LRDWLVAWLESSPDATLEIDCHGFEQATDARVSTSTMSRAIRCLGWTRKKKTVGAAERDESGVRNEKDERPRAWYRSMNAVRIVVSHRCGVRAFGQVPRNRGKNTTLVAAPGWSGAGESLNLEGFVTTAIFEQYGERILAPSLLAGQILLVDNLAAHKSVKEERVLKAKGCQVFFLPDFSPLEEMFSRLKASCVGLGLARMKPCRVDLARAMSGPLDPSLTSAVN
jgi:hypothetical protein